MLMLADCDAERATQLAIQAVDRVLVNKASFDHRIDDLLNELKFEPQQTFPAYLQGWECQSIADLSASHGGCISLCRPSSYIV